MEASQRVTADALLDQGMAPLDLARLSSMDFIESLTGNRLAFRLLQTPERVQIGKDEYLVARDIWGFAGPDPRTFAERLIECLQFTSNFFYQDVKKAAYQADQHVLLHMPKTFFNEAPVSQEQAWSAWLLADAARQAISEKDDEEVHTLVDALLLRFRSIVELAPLPEGNEVKEVTAAQNFQLKVETAGLIRAAEDLMSLTRELKEMWLFGPLRSLNEGEARANSKIDEDAKAVAAILDSLIKGDNKQRSTGEAPTEEKESGEDGGIEDDDGTKT